MCLHGKMILKGIEIHLIYFFPIQQFIAENLIKVHAESSIYSVPCLFYKASMQMELFSIQKIVIINSVHDREFELRNDEYLCTKKSLQETQWVEKCFEEAFVFCLFVYLELFKEGIKLT